MARSVPRARARAARIGAARDPVPRSGAFVAPVTFDIEAMARCEGYYKLENRRCDRDGAREVRAADGAHYLLCDYHRRQQWTTSVARWHGESSLRKSTPAPLFAPAEPDAFAWR